MIVVCKSKKILNLSDRLTKSGYSLQSEFYVEVGKSYHVFAINVWEGNLNYLIVDETGLPRWNLAELFVIKDKCIPSNWEVNNFNNDKICGLEIIIGYIEITSNKYHYIGLGEMDSDQLKIFEKANGIFL
jgi:hypothetical protein